jgi:Cu/Ag efflux pump CusA
MMRWIVGSSLRFRYIILALSVGLMYFGFQRIRDLPVDVFPEFAPTRVEIQTICLGLSPSEVEALVTVPLENVINGVPGIADLRSKSVPQLSSITAIFKPGVNEMLARQWRNGSVSRPTIYRPGPRRRI